MLSFTYTDPTTNYAFDATVERDGWSDTPWEYTDLVGSLRTVRSHYGQPAKVPGEILIAHENYSYVFYAYADAVKQLRREGLNGPGAAAVAKREANWLGDWYADRWFYATLRLTFSAGDTGGSSIGGLEVYDHWGETEFIANHGDCIADLVHELLPSIRSTYQATHQSGVWPAYA